MVIAHGLKDLDVRHWLLTHERAIRLIREIAQEFLGHGERRAASVLPVADGHAGHQE